MSNPSLSIKTIGRPGAALILTMGAAFGMMSEAHATSTIAAANGVTNCAVCHTSGAYSVAEGTAGLKAYCLSKYPTGGGAYNTKTFVCTAPAATPTPKPTATPAPTATPKPTATPVPTAAPTATPIPTTVPTVTPTTIPTTVPTVTPTTIPTTVPTVTPTTIPTTIPTVTPTPIPTTTGCASTDDEDDDDSAATPPTLTVANSFAVHAGEKLTFAATAYDCGDHSITIKAKGLPKGAKIVNGFDPELHMQKATITWNVPATTKPQTINVTLTAVESLEHHQTLSTSQTVSINVLAASSTQSDNADSSDVVASTSIATARYSAESKKLQLSGQVTWKKSSSKQDRQTAATSGTVSISGSGNTFDTTAPVSTDGKWSATVSTTAPCTVDATFLGKKAQPKQVKGTSPKTCQAD